MHSRIYNLTTTPLTEDEMYEIAQQYADYVDIISTNTQEEIDWLFDEKSPNYITKHSPVSFTITKEQQQQYYTDRISMIKEILDENDTAQNTYDNISYITNDKFGFLFYDGDDIYTFEELMRYADITRIYTIGQVFDYHW